MEHEDGDYNSDDNANLNFDRKVGIVLYWLRTKLHENLESEGAWNARRVRGAWSAMERPKFLMIVSACVVRAWRDTVTRTTVWVRNQARDSVGPGSTCSQRHVGPRELSVRVQVLSSMPFIPFSNPFSPPAHVNSTLPSFI
ncbi:hypothetical protein V6N12_024969 [Hibiscus sabdariffa]|uniref:Uncharacterized protein n=1 Tax=Hibiscus sabdariffa TaxID=183260 RepID=A0ABR1ZUT8_9ROSI